MASTGVFDVWRGGFDCFTKPANNVRYGRETIELNAGDMLIFRGDLWHAGAAYGHRNIRLHCYLDSRHVKRTPDSTFPIQKKHRWILNTK